jgi:hypothetical protein
MILVVFIINCIIGILLYIYIPKFWRKITKRIQKNYEIEFCIIYFSHPSDSNKKGELVKMKPMKLRVTADDEDDARNFMNQIVHDNIKIEISTIEEI